MAYLWACGVVSRSGLVAEMDARCVRQQACRERRIVKHNLDTEDRESDRDRVFGAVTTRLFFLPFRYFNIRYNPIL